MQKVRDEWVSACRHARDAIVEQRQAEAEARRALPWNRAALASVDAILSSRAAYRIPVAISERLESFRGRFDPSPVTRADVIGVVGSDAPPPPKAPKGVFLHGPVGTGKTLLMDLFYASASKQVSSPSSQGSSYRRVHFNSFMQEIQYRLHRYAGKAAIGRPGWTRSHLEMQCWTIRFTASASTTRLRAFAEILWATQRRARRAVLRRDFVHRSVYGRRNPRVLFALAEHGSGDRVDFEPLAQRAQREEFTADTFQPFVEAMGIRTDEVNVGEEGDVDYRAALYDAEKDKISSKSYVVGAPASEIYDELRSGVEETTVTLDVLFNRTFEVRGVPSKGVCRIDFHDLCGDATFRAPLTAALASSFRVIVVEGIPQLGDVSTRSLTREFISFVDEAYNRSVGVVCSADVALERLLEGADDEEMAAAAKLEMLEGVQFETSVTGAKSRVDLTETLETGGDVLETGKGLGRGVISGVAEEKFAAKRCASRLKEMQIH